MARGAAAAIPGARCDHAPLADGGEGTLEALLARGGRRLERVVTGPAHNPVTAAWGILPDGAAVVEMAEASGLRWMDPATHDLCSATSAGTGELIRAALAEGCERIIVGVGGSATNDGGTGAMRALGARFLDAEGGELIAASDMARLRRLDLRAFCDFRGVEVVAAADVDNPLCGPEGATATFGPQKGGTPEALRRLEAAMGRYAEVLRDTFGWDVAAAPGAGAAGGLGAALMAFLGARFRAGVDVVMDAVGFARAVANADVLVTGEGRLDTQTLRGKTLQGVLRRSSGKPVIALCGRVDLPEPAWRALGLSGAWGLANEPDTAADALAAPAAALERLTARALAVLA